MPDSDLRMAILKEMASIRHELAQLQDSRKPPLGPPDFILNYTAHLNARLAQLGQELNDADEGAAS